MSTQTTIEDYEVCVEALQTERCIDGPQAPLLKNGVPEEEIERVLEDCFERCRQECRELLR